MYYNKYTATLHSTVYCTLINSKYIVYIYQYLERRCFRKCSMTGLCIVLALIY